MESGYHEGTAPTLKAQAQRKKNAKKKDAPLPDFFDQKAHVVVIDGMKTLIDQVSVQIEGCTALRSMITNQASKKKVLLKNGVIGTLYNSMSRYSKDPALQEAALALLAGLAMIKESHNEMLKTEIYELIILAMKEHTQGDDEQLQFHGVMALHNLSRADKKASKVLKKSKAIEAGVRAKTYYKENEILVRKAQDMTRLVIRGGKI